MATHLSAQEGDWSSISGPRRRSRWCCRGTAGLGREGRSGATRRCLLVHADARSRHRRACTHRPLSMPLKSRGRERMSQCYDYFPASTDAAAEFETLDPPPLIIRAVPVKHSLATTPRAPGRTWTRTIMRHITRQHAWRSYRPDLMQNQQPTRTTRH